MPMAHYEALSEWNFRFLKYLTYCFYDIVRPKASANKTFIVYFLQKDIWFVSFYHYDTSLVYAPTNARTPVEYFQQK